MDSQLDHNDDTSQDEGSLFLLEDQLSNTCHEVVRCRDLAACSYRHSYLLSFFEWPVGISYRGCTLSGLIIGFGDHIVIILGEL